MKGKTYEEKKLKGKKIPKKKQKKLLGSWGPWRRWLGLRRLRSCGAAAWRRRGSRCRCPSSPAAALTAPRRSPDAGGSSPRGPDLKVYSCCLRGLTSGAFARVAQSGLAPAGCSLLCLPSWLAREPGSREPKSTPEPGPRETSIPCVSAEPDRL
jgi:hypothetical protein